MPALWFEDCHEGLVIDHAVRRTITEADNVLFSVMTLNMAPLHLDAEYSKNTQFGQRLVNSLFVLGLVCGVPVRLDAPGWNGGRSDSCRGARRR